MSQRRARESRQGTRPSGPQQRRTQPSGPQRRKQPSLLNDRRIWASAGFLALVAVVAVGVVTARGTGAAEPIVQAAGEPVSFSGTDPVTGKRVSLDKFAGKPVVINVWGSWCPGCVAEAEDLRDFAADHPEVQLVGVDMQDSTSAAQAFYERWHWTHPSVFDPDASIAFSLGLQGTPSTFFLDRQHRLVTRIVGETDYAGFERALEATLSAS